MRRQTIGLLLFMIGIAGCGGLIAPDVGGDDEGSGDDAGFASIQSDGGHDATTRDSGVGDAYTIALDSSGGDSSSMSDSDAEVADITRCTSTIGNIIYVVPAGVLDASSDPIMAIQSTGTWSDLWTGQFLQVYVMDEQWNLAMHDINVNSIGVGNYSFGETAFPEYFGVITPEFNCEGPAQIRIDQLDTNVGGDLGRLLMTYRVTCSLGGESGSISGCLSYSNP